MIQQVKNSVFFKELSLKHSVYFVGGCVRDFYLNTSSKDIDLLACGIEMPELILFLKQHGNVNLVGESFSVVKFKPFELLLDEPIDIALPRKEIKIGDKHTDFKIISDSTITLEEDLKRRDFTFNSMCLDKDLNLIDPFNGLKDLKDGIIRMTDEKAFAEDSLRALRAIRFTSRFGFVIEQETFKNIEIFASKLNTLSKERVREELLKTLQGNGFIRGIELFIQLGLIEHIGLPELKLTIGMTQNYFHNKDVFGHISDVIINSKPTALHRLAAMLHDIGKANTKSIDENGVVHFYDHENVSKIIAERFMKELKFSTEEIDLVTTAVESHMRISSDITDKKIRKVRSKLGDAKFEFLLDLCEADRLSHTDKSVEHIKRAREIKLKETNITSANLLVNGDDIMEMFDLKPCKKVGDMLKIVSDLMFENPEITKEEIIKVLVSV